MSKEKKVCVFDNSKECPVRTAQVATGEYSGDMISSLLTEACPICPIRIKMIPSRKIK